MSRTVLDASALLALINEEPGRDAVAENVDDAVISAVNFSEVAARMLDLGTPEPLVRERLEAMSLEVVPFDSRYAYETANLRASTRPYGLSLGDRACLALAQSLGVPVLTTDRVWAELRLGIEVQVIR